MMIKFLEILHFLRYFCLSEFYEYFRQYLHPRKVWAAQILDLGVIFNEKSDAPNILSKFQNFTLSRNKVWNLPIFRPQLNKGDEQTQMHSGLTLGDCPQGLMRIIRELSSGRIHPFLILLRIYNKFYFDINSKR